MRKSKKIKGLRVFLVRHGETEWNRIRRFQGRSDVPLNQKGKSQARALAVALKNESIAAIHSSPLIRAVETARIIGDFHPEIPFFEEKDLIEMDLGDFDGMLASRWTKEFPEFFKVWQEKPSSAKMPGGESLKDVQDRAVYALEKITGQYPSDSTILISGHNFVNLSILSHALEIPLDRIREVKQDTAALNVLYKQGNRLWAENVNDLSHLAGV